MCVSMCTWVHECVYGVQACVACVYVGMYVHMVCVCMCMCECVHLCVRACVCGVHACVACVYGMWMCVCLC